MELGLLHVCYKKTADWGSQSIDLVSEAAETAGYSDIRPVTTNNSTCNHKLSIYHASCYEKRLGICLRETIICLPYMTTTAWTCFSKAHKAMLCSQWPIVIITCAVRSRKSKSLHLYLPYTIYTMYTRTVNQQWAQWWASKSQWY